MATDLGLKKLSRLITTSHPFQTKAKSERPSILLYGGRNSKAFFVAVNQLRVICQHNNLGGRNAVYSDKRPSFRGPVYPDHRASRMWAVESVRLCHFGRVEHNRHGPVAAQIQQMSLEAFAAVDAAGLARVDFFYTESGEVLINEINTIPGFTATSMYPMMWEKSGIPFPELVDRLIQLALERNS